MNSGHDLLTPLRRYWGYDAFRPLQEGIVRNLLEGRDTCVIMPTGGGKSLCYQLPAAMSPEKTVVVISPLIALMEDQVAQLGQMGISAGLLNSTISAGEQARVIEKAREGGYRLLYLSPERLAREDTIEWLRGVSTLFFAIDEAHCISEWGHEFRPEYRQLSRLRAHFPDRAIAAFTASATQRVRHDIIRQLQLRDPHKCIASFHRPNLRYVVRACDAYSQTELLLRAMRSYGNENIIVYAPTIARVESTVDLLQENGIPAIGYHGQMNAGDRRRNQERWMADEVRVMVGTIAFGLGINKAAVRAVIHLSLPKSIEQYYQEAGRGGRDGLPADCVLLWQKKDAGLHAYFIGLINDPEEKKRAWQRYDEIRGFVESDVCRHHCICAHFGEKRKWEACGACDVCAYEPEWLSAPVENAPRSRKRSKSRSAASTPTPVRRAWEGPAPAQGRLPAADSDVNPDLREFLREWRRDTAKEQNVVAFVVMHDTTLDAICRARPKSIRDLLQIGGIGERKAELYGRQILDALKRFEGGARATTPGKRITPSDETIQLLDQGKTLDEIAALRGRRLSTIVSMVSDLVERGLVEFQAGWVEEPRRKQIETVAAELGLETFSPIKNVLPPDFTYDEIRLVVADLRRRSGGQSLAAST
ncbi:MAG TPA: RecQ family ATP-dependent DNA helicase [Candidatus Acidoferrales bacterium]|nr:RecQ family ATP-dependent DNA helicase [Candidatus Acidoferrales bacterium]